MPLQTKTDHIAPHLQTLHWLQVNARIQDKICSLCFNAINSSGPQNLAELLQIYTPSCQLRFSADTCLLYIPSVHTKSYGQRCLFTLCTYLLSGTIFLKLFKTQNLLSFFQIHPKNLSVSALQLNN